MGGKEDAKTWKESQVHFPLLHALGMGLLIPFKLSKEEHNIDELVTMYNLKLGSANVEKGFIESG
jgi:hypothetical protein